MEYVHKQTFEYPNAIVKVYSPVLDPKERERRMKILHDAAAEILRWANPPCGKKENQPEGRKNSIL